VGLQFPSKGNGYARVCAPAVAVTTRRYVSPSLATLGGVGLAYASVTSRSITPTERWLEPLALMVLIGILWWRAAHPRAPQPTIRRGRQWRPMLGWRGGSPSAQPQSPSPRWWRSPYSCGWR
jgi:hypothetical protein